MTRSRMNDCVALVALAVTLALPLPSFGSMVHEPTRSRESSAIVVASWYGTGFHGRRTASGQVFDQERLTAAHKTLPFGTKLRVTNLRNGRSVLVTVTDRGPFVRNRQLDVSFGAARRLGLVNVGTAPVLIEKL
jgi:peptidoglycan lytic transglycosylase